MNWILLIIAGLFEVGFASCLGKAKETTGMVSNYWMGGFFACLTISMVLLYKATKRCLLVLLMRCGQALAQWVLC